MKLAWDTARRGVSETLRGEFRRPGDFQCSCRAGAEGESAEGREKPPWGVPPPPPSWFWLLCRAREGDLPRRGKRSWPGPRPRRAVSETLRGEFRRLRAATYFACPFVWEGLEVNRPKAERSHPGVCPRRPYLVLAPSVGRAVSETFCGEFRRLRAASDFACGKTLGIEIDHIKREARQRLPPLLH